MKPKKPAEPAAALRRASIAQDIEAYLKAGNKIDQVPDGVSGQDPQGRGKPLTLGNQKR